jgi:hypothetical protein
VQVAAKLLWSLDSFSFWTLKNGTIFGAMVRLIDVVHAVCRSDRIWASAMNAALVR